MASKHVFPLLLDGAKEVDSTTWSGNTSVVELDNTNMTVGSANLPGTMLTVISTTATSSVVTFTDSVSAHNNVVTLDAVGESVLAMWNGSAWAVIGGVEAPAAA